MNVIALDPGPTHTAVVGLGDGKLYRREILPNEAVLDVLGAFTLDAVVCEMVQSFGMAVGREIFDTVLWIGRYSQVRHGKRFDLVYRGEVKMHLCNSMRAKDSNIRQALVDMFGGEDAIGKKAAPGPLYGFKADLWAALGVLVTWCDREGVAIAGSESLRRSA